MTGYDAFTLYQAIKLHFTVPSYDYFKYQHKTKCTVESYDRRKDKYMYHKLCRKYSQQGDLEFFLAANFFGCEDRKIWIGDLLKDDADELCLEKRKIKESLEYTVKEDLRKIHITSPLRMKESLQVQGGEYPVLLTATMQHDIHPETLVAIDVLTGCLDIWSKRITDTIIYPSFRLRLQRYLPFLQVDQKTLSQTLRQFLCDPK